ncbi:NADAR family protein [Couchioplanes caeruleus]|uniref:Uncharacterized protein n=2 Tax=Couchioplanes caeruleus TaxID=56438 RepID=A0A1K0GEZ1_9ACTN|nr:NADAR family protein [Couchioplanes caeruleus]OJF10726.1 hypothetical protein BG844_30470 [Couchioplanes caeruleus subsp. caeruleus]ROP31282.1 putative NAD-dependent protein-ADP-ribosyltransferase YbiA (DUF1768 family) [Couchioplanes caeruleus]
MTRYRRTYRDVAGQRIEGTWRHIFTRNMNTYFLTDLIIYADGAIDCGTGGLTDLDGLAEQLRCGRVATTLEDGAWASAHHLAGWRFTEPDSAINAEMLLGEVADEVDRLNDRPDSTGRCLQAVTTYLADPTENNRRTVRERYLAIPEHLRTYALGDMDRKDAPLRILITDLGKQLHGWPNGPVVTEQKLAEAVAYFREREIAIETRATRIPADGPEHPQQPTLTIPKTVYPRGWPDPPGVEVLQNDYPAVITIGANTYPSVTHAYWALSTPDPGWHEQITAAPRRYDAGKLAEQAPRRTDWATARLAVMTALLRAKYTQHTQMAQTLRASGDARIVYVDFDSAYWSANGKRGNNWIGRLLEVIRSELATVGARIPLPTTHDVDSSASTGTQGPTCEDGAPGASSSP